MSAPRSRCLGCRASVALVDLIDADKARASCRLGPYGRWYCWKCYERIGSARAALDARGVEAVAEQAAGSADMLDACLTRRRAPHIVETRRAVSRALLAAIPSSSASEVASLLGLSRDTVAAAVQ